MVLAEVRTQQMIPLTHSRNEINFPKFCVLKYASIQIYCRTYRSVGYRYESSTELAEPAGYGMRVVQKPLFTMGYFYNDISVPRVKVNFSHRSHTNVGYRYERLNKTHRIVGYG